MHSQVASQLKGAKLELRELKARSSLLVLAALCLDLIWRLLSLRLNILSINLSILLATVFYPLCVNCDFINGKLFYATKENTELKQEVTYLIAHLEKTILREKMIENDLSIVKESATKSTYKLNVGFERCEKKNKNNAPKFVPGSNYHQEEKTLKPTKIHYPSNPKSSFNQKRKVRKKPPSRRGSFCLHVLWPCWSLG
jgi:hypothetical protein